MSGKFYSSSNKILRNARQQTLFKSIKMTAIFNPNFDFICYFVFRALEYFNVDEEHFIGWILSFAPVWYVLKTRSENTPKWNITGIINLLFRWFNIWYERIFCSLLVFSFFQVTNHFVKYRHVFLVHLIKWIFF